MASKIAQNTDEKMTSKGKYATPAKIGSYILLLGSGLVLIGIIVEAWLYPLLPPGTYNIPIPSEFTMLIPFSIILIVWKLGLSENEWPALVLQGGLTLAASLALLYMFFLIPFFTVLPLIGSVACLIGSLLSITFGVLRKPY